MNKIDDKQSNNTTLEDIVNKLSELEGWLKTMESRVSILEYDLQKLDKTMRWSIMGQLTQQFNEEHVIKVKELIRELQKLDGELRVFASADMIDVYYGEIIGVDVNEIEVNGIKGETVELEFTDTNLQTLSSSM